jgi:hypothetical protein
MKHRPHELYASLSTGFHIFPAEKLRDINALIEREAGGGYRTEFYATYDYRALYRQEQSKNS